MSQQNRRQRPNDNQANQQYPQATPPQYNQALPPNQPSQPEKIYIERKTNPAIVIMKAIAYPFVKLAQFVGNIFAIILQELLRSIVSFVIGLILLIVFVVLIGGYVYALFQTNFSFVEAVPEMLNIFASFFRFGG